MLHRYGAGQHGEIERDGLEKMHHPERSALPWPSHFNVSDTLGNVQQMWVQIFVYQDHRDSVMPIFLSWV